MSLLINVNQEPHLAKYFGGEKSELNRTPAWIAGRPAGLQPVGGTSPVFPILFILSAMIEFLYASHLIILLRALD